MTLRERERLAGWQMILPAALLIGGMIFYPVARNVYLSFFNVRIGSSSDFIGLRNYLNVLADRSFWVSLWVTFLYVVLTTGGSTLLGLGVALVMNKKFPLRGLVRSLILFPYVAPLISVVFAWRFMLDPVNGIVMHRLVETWGFLDERINVIDGPATSGIAAIVFGIWKNFPFAYLMILARLQAIDASLYQAAEVDGANALQKFLYITLPELFFTVATLVLLRAIWSFNRFEEIFLLTENFRVLSIYTYFRAFTGALKLGEGAALALVQFCILIGLIFLYIRKVIRW